MDPKETGLYYSIVLGIVLLSLVVAYFIYRLIDQRRTYETRMQLLLDREMNTCVNMRLDIVRDIHDDIGALLSTLLLDVDRLRVTAENEDSKNNACLLLQHIINRSRAIPTFPTNTKALLEDLKQFSVSLHNKSIRINIDCGIEPEFTEQQCVQLSLLLKEIIHNTIKHSGGTRLRILIECEEGQGLIKAADNGKGFGYHENSKEITAGIGMNSIMHRVRQLQGTIDIESKPGRGVKYRIAVPLAPINES